MYVISASQTDTGRKRSNNQDFIASWEPQNKDDVQYSGNLYIVADGVGGASKGERASQYAAQKVQHEYYRSPEISPGDRLTELIRLAGNDINTFAEDSPQFMRMGTTMVAAVLRGNKLTVANVGDSRAYLIREGVVNQITRDHSLVGELVRDGVMTEEEARVSKKKNRITRSLGGERNVRVDIFEDIQLAVGDIILLCTDGFSQYAGRDTIASLLSNGSPENIANRLIQHANQNGGSDNISVIVIEIVAEPSALAETVVASRRPAPVDWNTMVTDSGRAASKTRSGFKITRKETVALTVFFIAFLAIGTFYVYNFFLGNMSFSSKNTEENPLSTSVKIQPPNTVPPSDTIPPRAITNLTVAAVTESGTVDLTWTAPGDDGDFGTAASYLVRYSSVEIVDDATWESATEITVGVPNPQAAGAPERMTITGLNPDVTYYFAIRALDELPNLGDLSNSPTIIVVAIDTISPVTITDLTATAGTEKGIVELTWSAPGDDEDIGTAASYLVRYSNVAISDEPTWESATPVNDGVPTPQISGSEENMTITGLNPGGIYNFSVRAQDESANLGGLSNSTSATASQELGLSTCRYEFIYQESSFKGKYHRSTWVIYIESFGLESDQYFKIKSRIKCADDQTINNLTHQCTYIPGDESIPSDSVLDFPDIPESACFNAGGTVIPSQ